MMNGYSLRSASALARRSLATPPTVALQSSSSSSVAAARLLSTSSTSSALPSSRRSFSSALRVPRPSRVAASTRWSGSTPSLYLNQSRTMASESTKIKVKNPVVELDGDEV